MKMVNINILKTICYCVVHVACMGKMRNAYKSFVGRPEGKRQLGKPRHR
jgi:hypothetical protein